MPLHERREHFRIDDHVYFDYRVVGVGQFYSDLSLKNELLGEKGQLYMEMANYFQDIEYELAELTQTLSVKEPALAHYLNLLNAKIDYVSKQIMLGSKIQMHKVNLSLGGMSFQTPEQIKEKSRLKIILYTKPKMTPILVDAQVVFCQYQKDGSYRIAVAFENLTMEQEQLLSQHILLVQVKSRAV